MIQVIKIYRTRVIGDVHFFWNMLDAVRFGEKWMSLDNKTISQSSRSYTINIS